MLVSQVILFKTSMLKKKSKKRPKTPRKRHEHFLFGLDICILKPGKNFDYAAPMGSTEAHTLTFMRRKNRDQSLNFLTYNGAFSRPQKIVFGPLTK